MRKLFLLIVLLGSVSVWAQKQYTITSKSPSGWAPLAEGEVNIHTSLINSAVNSKDTLFWVEYLDATIPSSWTIGLCTNVQCYSVSSTTGLKEFFYTGKGNTTDIKCTQSFGTASGKGYARFIVYRDGMKSLADTIFFNGNAAATGLKNAATPTEVSIYPNPVKNDLILTLSEVNLTSLTILNIIGKEVMKLDAMSGKSFDVSSLPNGIYFLNIKKGEISFNKKFVISK